MSKSRTNPFPVPCEVVPGGIFHSNVVGPEDQYGCRVILFQGDNETAIELAKRLNSHDDLVDALRRIAVTTSLDGHAVRNIARDALAGLGVR